VADNDNAKLIGPGSELAVLAFDVSVSVGVIVAICLYFILFYKEDNYISSFHIYSRIVNVGVKYCPYLYIPPPPSQKCIPKASPHTRALYAPAIYAFDIYNIDTSALRYYIYNN
tara:strand:- start:57 stop:398 length:342 start_codon:yes stop_codon:yes gene_type:complete